MIQRLLFKKSNGITVPESVNLKFLSNLLTRAKEYIKRFAKSMDQPERA